MCVCVVLFIHHTKHMRSMSLSSVVRVALPYVSTLFRKRYDFRGKKFLNVKCVFWFALKLWYERFFTLKNNSVKYCNTREKVFV